MATDISAGDMPVRPAGLPDIDINVEQAFGFKSDMTVKGYSEITEHVPQIDESYRLDRATTLGPPDDFSPTGSFLKGNGSTMTLADPSGPSSSHIYRIVIP